MKNFDQIEVGDVVTAQYQEETAIFVRPSTGPPRRMPLEPCRPQSQVKSRARLPPAPTRSPQRSKASTIPIVPSRSRATWPHSDRSRSAPTWKTSMPCGRAMKWSFATPMPLPLRSRNKKAASGQHGDLHRGARVSQQGGGDVPTGCQGAESRADGCPLHPMIMISDGPTRVKPGPLGHRQGGTGLTRAVPPEAPPPSDLRGGATVCSVVARSVQAAWRVSLAVRCGSYRLRLRIMAQAVSSSRSPTVRKARPWLWPALRRAW